MSETRTHTHPDMAELAALVRADGQTVTAGGKELLVAPLSLAALPAVLRGAQALIGAIASGAPIERALVDGAEQLPDLLAAATGCDRQWAANLPAAEAIALAAVVVEVNADFFVRVAAPAVARAQATLAGRRGMATTAVAAGPTPSSG